MVFNHDYYDFFKKFNKVRWYSIKIFYNFKKSFDILKYINFDGFFLKKNFDWFDEILMRKYTLNNLT